MLSPEPNYTDYARDMRLALSDPDMITPAGAINHRYFMVKKDAFWNGKHQEALLRGLDLFGVGQWKDIMEYELQGFGVIEIELRVCLTLRTNNLTKYMGKKLKATDIAQIQRDNLKLAKKENCQVGDVYYKE